VADINVERKGPSVWPWVVGLLILALLVWGLMELFGGAPETNGSTASPDTTFIDSLGGTPP